MHHSIVTTDPTRQVVRWTARIFSILFILVFALMLFGNGINISGLTLRGWVSLFFFPLGASLGMVLGWWQEGLGGAITVVSVFLSILIHDSSSGGGYMFACASPGILFLLSWMLSMSPSNERK